MAGNEKRSYIRDNTFYSSAKIETDSGKKYTVTISDFSAGGLNFRIEKYADFKNGDILTLDMKIGEFPKFHETEIKTKVKICRVAHDDGSSAYGAAFMDLSPELRIRVDEIILYKKRKRKILEVE